MGGRQRRPRKQTSPSEEEKRPRTAFTPQQLKILKQQFMDNRFKGSIPGRGFLFADEIDSSWVENKNNFRYLTEKRRQELAHELGLNESQIKIWFQVREWFTFY